MAVVMGSRHVQHIGGGETAGASEVAAGETGRTAGATAAVA